METTEQNNNASASCIIPITKIILLLENRSTFALINKLSQNIGYEPIIEDINENETPIDAVKRIIEDFTGFSVKENDHINLIGEMTIGDEKTLIYHVDIRDYLNDRLFKWKQPEKNITNVFGGTIRELIANNNQSLSPLLRITMEMYDKFYEHH